MANNAKSFHIITTSWYACCVRYNSIRIPIMRLPQWQNTTPIRKDRPAIKFESKYKIHRPKSNRMCLLQDLFLFALASMHQASVNLSHIYTSCRLPTIIVKSNYLFPNPIILPQILSKVITGIKGIWVNKLLNSFWSGKHRMGFRIKPNLRCFHALLGM